MQDHMKIVTLQKKLRKRAMRMHDLNCLFTTAMNSSSPGKTATAWGMVRSRQHSGPTPT